MAKCISILAFFLLCVIVALCEFHHQPPEQYKLSLGWQEPGLWRPKWVMDRVFTTTADDGSEEVVKRDRIYFRMKNDRTMKIYRQRDRPFLEWRKKRDPREEKKKQLFERGDEVQESVEERFHKSVDVDPSLFDVDGVWWWQDAAPLNGAKVKLETKEEIEEGTGLPTQVKQKGGSGIKEKIMHDVNCIWGTLDGYAAKFRKGKIFQYKMSSAGVPIGTKQIGSFRVRVSTHRPLVMKDFQAFQ
jgi:hypothetical protein